MTTSSAPVFRFEVAKHEYFLNEQRIPSASELLERGGLYGDAAKFYTEAGRDRGTDVHDLTRDYDLGALDIKQLETPNRGAVLGYIAASVALNPAWECIEEAECHAGYRFGCRPDRVGAVMERPTIAEIKRAAKAKWHAVQTALQALAVSYRTGIRPEDYQRLVIYVKPTGKFTVEVHQDRRDFDTAMQLIRRFC